MFLAIVDLDSLAVPIFLLLPFESYLVILAQPVLSLLFQSQQAISQFFSAQYDLVKGQDQLDSVSSHRLLSPQITF